MDRGRQKSSSRLSPFYHGATSSAQRPQHSVAAQLVVLDISSAPETVLVPYDPGERIVQQVAFVYFDETVRELWRQRWIKREVAVALGCYKPLVSVVCAGAGSLVHRSSGKGRGPFAGLWEDAGERAAGLTQSISVHLTVNSTMADQVNSLAGFVDGTLNLETRSDLPGTEAPAPISFRHLAPETREVIIYEAIDPFGRVYAALLSVNREFHQIAAPRFWEVSEDQEMLARVADPISPSVPLPG
jgi:hypothetical protein